MEIVVDIYLKEEELNVKIIKKHGKKENSFDFKDGI